MKTLFVTLFVLSIQNFARAEEVSSNSDSFQNLVQEANYRTCDGIGRGNSVMVCRNKAVEAGYPKFTAFWDGYGYVCSGCF